MRYLSVVHVCVPKLRWQVRCSHIQCSLEMVNKGWKADYSHSDSSAFLLTSRCKREPKIQLDSTKSNTKRSFIYPTCVLFSLALFFSQTFCFFSMNDASLLLVNLGNLGIPNCVTSAKRLWSNGVSPEATLRPPPRHGWTNHIELSCQEYDAHLCMIDASRWKWQVIGTAPSLGS